MKPTCLLNSGAGAPSPRGSTGAPPAGAPRAREPADRSDAAPPRRRDGSALIDRRSRFARRVALLLAFPGLAAGPARAVFQDVTFPAGIAYQYALPGSFANMGQGGIAAVDVDGDGWTDLLGSRRGAPPVLYLNQRDGTFREEAALRGLAPAVDANAFAGADFDNDGDADLFVAPAQGNRFFLFLNDGTGHFTEEAVSRGAAVETTLEVHQAFSVSVVDYDRDGFLDVHVTEWGPAAPAEFDRHTVLLRNRGAAAPGHFENATVAAGLLQAPPFTPVPALNAARQPQQTAFSAAWADFDGDGWPDLALVADFAASRMYWNNHDGTFTEGTAAAGLGLDENGMGVAAADYDGDGRLDLFVSSIFDERNLSSHSGNKLYRNLGQRRFAEVAEAAGVARTGWGWGAAFLDYQNLGHQSLLVTNGMDGVQQGGVNGLFNAALTDQTALLANDGAGHFTNVSDAEGIFERDLGRGIAVLDFDHDGAEDFLIAHAYAGPILFRNLAAGNHWIRFRFAGTVSNRDGVGAVVRVTAGGRTQTLLFQPTNSFGSQHESVLHAGLGALIGAIERIEITWPSGIRQILAGVAADQELRVVEPGGGLLPARTGPVALGGDVALDAAPVGPVPTFEWRREGRVLAGVAGRRLGLTNLQPADAGIYTAEATTTAGADSRQTFIVAPSLPAGVRAAGAVVAAAREIRHPNGNRYDQFLLTGAAATLASEPGKITRVSYVDLNGDIVQVEFSGPGSLTLLLENPAGPAPAANYRQPGVSYLQGHARLFFTDTTADSHLNVFTVGKLTAFDPTGAWDLARPVSAANDPLANGNPIFVPGGAYDGIADLASIAIVSDAAAFGGLRAGNVAFSASTGLAGIYAPGIAFSGPVVLHDLTAFGDATPVLDTGAIAGGDVVVAGGALDQPNRRSLQIASLARLVFRDGTDSHARRLTAQPNRARIERTGVDATVGTVVEFFPGP